MAAAAGLAFVLALAAVPVLAKEKYEEKFAKTESLERDGKVVIVNVSGKIEIRSWDQAQVKIEAVKVSQASTLDKAKEDAAKVTIEVAKTGNILTIETKYPESRMFRGNNINVSVDYILMVPDKAGVKARNVSGSVLAEGIGGPLEVDVVSGTVTVSKAAQGLDLRTVSGTITVADAAGDADLKTVSGTIKAERIKGSISAETTSGAVRLTEVSGAKSIRAKVLSGNITYGGEIQAGGRYGFEALSGTIEVELPASASFDLDAETFSGHIQTDFPVTMSGRISPKEIRGVVGSGGSTLRVKSFSGSIRIVKK
jgi:DUF4097 and DUF4098 domain-containing protein YvlB